MRAVAAASPRVRVETIGESEEGREMIAVIMADEQTIRLDVQGHAAAARGPAAHDPAQAERSSPQAKPVYYATARCTRRRPARPRC
jgi:hypothetical protein